MELNEKKEVIDKEAIGKRLKELRKKEKLKQKEVAEKLNITRSAYTQYELGISLITLESAMKLAEVYRCSLDYLVGRYKDS